MKRSYHLWLLAFFITAASAVFQRMTGPTYPKNYVTLLDGKAIEVVLQRAHGGTTDHPVTVAVNVTPAPQVDGLRLDATAVVVAPWVTVTETLAVAVPLTEPVPVTVWSVAPRTAVGVPLITPVPALNTSPAGSAGLIAYVTLPPKPVAVYAVVGVIAVPTVPVTVCVSGAIDWAATSWATPSATLAR